MIWRVRGIDLQLDGRTLVMGIVNATPDSFSGDGVMARYRREKVPGLAYALRQAEEGADIVDVGGASSRPGAVLPTPEEEARRVVPLIAGLVRRVKIPVSVDTYRADVARRALDAGASIVNVIKGPSVTKALLNDVAGSGAGLVLMHMRGTPVTMQSRVVYRDVVTDIKVELKKALAACAACGISKERIVIDPGIGFAKTVDQNLELLRRLKEFRGMGYPLLVGTSRKSFIGKVLGLEAGDRLMGTAATVALAAVSGASIVRVHDVRAMKEVVSMVQAVINVKKGKHS